MVLGSLLQKRVLEAVEECQGSGGGAALTQLSAGDRAVEGRLCHLKS